MKREFLMLAQTYSEQKHNASGWFVSEKLDGMRAFWDGGVSRGKPTAEIPFANTTKDARYREEQIATGLWSRYAKPIQAPGWFLSKLPNYPLDGELYMGRGRFQDVMSTVKDLIPGPNWHEVEYRVFDAPPPRAVLYDGEIKNPTARFTLRGAVEWYDQNQIGGGHGCLGFESVYNWLKENLVQCKSLILHHQEMLPFNTAQTVARLRNLLDEVTTAGGEGLMLRKNSSFWSPQRSWDLLKVKKLHDMEGTVVGYTAGKETDLGSKLLGLMGSVRLRLPNGNEFDLSGFTDEERALVFLDGSSCFDYVAERQGQPLDVGKVTNVKFPVGSKVTFRYREMTEDQMPKEARYLRKHHES